MHSACLHTATTLACWNPPRAAVRDLKPRSENTPRRHSPGCSCLPPRYSPRLELTPCFRKNASATGRTHPWLGSLRAVLSDHSREPSFDLRARDSLTLPQTRVSGHAGCKVFLTRQNPCALAGRSRDDCPCGLALFWCYLRATPQILRLDSYPPALTSVA